MLPGFNLDAVHRRKKMPDRCEEGVPGCFSPRPTHARSLSDRHNSLEPDDPPSPSPLPASPEGFARTTAPATIASMHSNVLEQRERPLRHAPPKATLLEHQQARSSATDGGRTAKAAIPRTGSGTFAAAHRNGGGGGTNTNTTTTTHTTAADAGGSRSGSSHNNSIERGVRPKLQEAYVAGKVWARGAAGTRRAQALHPGRVVTALAASGSGEYVAVGEASGRIAVMRREEGTKAHDGGKGNGGNEHGSGSNNEKVMVRRPYNFIVGRQAYTSIIDPLNSVEVTPNIQALCFLPQISPTTYLLTSNEKLPKLYKVMSVRESPAPFAAVDRLGAKSVGSLTLNPPHGSSTVAMKEVTRYALNHEYNINSLCPLTDSSQFFSADDLTVKLWCTEFPDTSIESYSLKSPFNEEIQETICGIRTFPHEPFLLFVVTSSGSVRVVDTRQTLKWLHQSPLVFNNKFCEEDGVPANSLSDCALSPCGRYVAGRDLMSVCLWDIRRASLRDHMSRPASMNFSFVRDEQHNVVSRWELYPQLRLDLVEKIYQMESLVRFTLRFLNSREVATGGFASMLYVLDVLDDTETNSDGVNCHSGLAFELPQLDNERGTPRGPLPSFSLDDVNYMSADPDTLFGAVTMQLSQPLTSAGGDCSVLASCGPAVFQLAYTCR